jgi:hypothetical protein
MISFCQGEGAVCGGGLEGICDDRTHTRTLVVKFHIGPIIGSGSPEIA